MGQFNAYMALSGMIDTDVIENERLSRHTSYRIGGPCQIFVTCHSYHSLRRTIDVLNKQQVEWVILGKGSNLLVADEGFRGAVITLGREFQRFVVAEDDATITVGAAVMLARLVNEAFSRALSGLEFAVGIPGSVGGAISMNAGSRHDWIGSLVETVTTYCPGEGLKHYSYDEIYWGYRETSIPKNEIILEATLKLTPSDKSSVRVRMEQNLQRRKKSQPIGKPSCGSVFRNPADKHVGQMIEACGLKGFSIGGAQVSDIHANFIVNNGNATADEVSQVMQVVFGKVRETYGIELQTEVKFLGF